VRYVEVEIMGQRVLPCLAHDPDPSEPSKKEEDQKTKRPARELGLGGGYDLDCPIVGDEGVAGGGVERLGEDPEDKTL
jgi:hypothetical protein